MILLATYIYIHVHILSRVLILYVNENTRKNMEMVILKLMSIIDYFWDDYSYYLIT